MSCVYFAHQGTESRIPTLADDCKIGLTRNLRKRMRKLNCRAYFALECDVGAAEVLEWTLHRRFADQRFQRVRWGPEGHTEWFWLNEEMAGLIEYVVAEHRWPWPSDPFTGIWCP